MTFWKGVIAFNMLAVVFNIVVSALGLVPPTDAGEVWRHAFVGLIHLGVIYYIYLTKPSGA